MPPPLYGDAARLFGDKCSLSVSFLVRSGEKMSATPFTKTMEKVMEVALSYANRAEKSVLPDQIARIHC